MQEIDVNEFYNLKEDMYMTYLFERPYGKIKVKCFDGEILTTYRHMAFVYSYMNYNREFNIPVTVNQLLRYDVNPTDSVHIAISDFMLKYVDDYLNTEKHVITLAEIARIELSVLELQINSAMSNLEAHAMTIDAEDYWFLHSHPEVVTARRKMFDACDSTSEPGEMYKAIRQAYDEFDAIVAARMDTDFLMNGLAGLIRCSCTKLTQLHQGIVARGFVSEVNSNFYALPILHSFAEGLKTIYEYGAESRSGAKASMYTGGIMGDTEYLHRLVQMVAATFQRVHLMDCGSTVTYPFPVEEKYLPYIIGKYYLEDGVVHEIMDKDKSLIGKTLNFRFPAGCAINDRSGCCSICAGAVSKSLPEGTNVGHTASTRYIGSGSQKVLSVKHDDLTSLSSCMNISEQFTPFLTLADNNREVLYTPNGTMTMAWKYKMCDNLDDLYSRTDIATADLDIPEFSKVGDITFFDTSSDYNTGAINGCLGSKGEVVHFSAEFLEFVRLDRRRLETVWVGRTKYSSVDLTRFPKNKPLFITPFQHFDMITQHKATKAFLHSPVAGDMVKLTDYHTFGEAARTILDITMEKLGINLCVLELSIYPFTVTSIADHDYRPIRHSNACEFLPMDELYDHRSISSKLFSEKQVVLLKSPLAITVENRMLHAYDPMFQ